MNLAGVTRPQEAVKRSWVTAGARYCWVGLWMLRGIAPGACGVSGVPPWRLRFPQYIG
jgi:hypothetical protein